MLVSNLLNEEGNLMKEYSQKERALGLILEDKAKTNKGMTFIYYGEQRITYDQVNEQAKRIGSAFLELGVKKGDNVAIMMDNCPEYVYLWFGLSKIGAVEVPINTAIKGWQLHYTINESDATILVIDKLYIDRLIFVQGELKTLRRIIVYPEFEDGKPSLDLKFSQSTFNELYHSRTPISTDVKHSDLVAIMYTSGTSGPPKGVMLCHNHEYVLARNLVKVMELSRKDVYYNFYPYFHNTAQALITLPMLLADGAVAIVPRFSVSKFWSDVDRYKCTALWLFPAQVNLLLKQACPGRTSLRVVMGIGADEKATKEIEEKWGVRLIQSYGSTDANIISGYLPGDKARPGSAGRVFEEWEIKIVDQDDNELPPDKMGEIVIRHKEPFTLNLGYWKQPEATLASWRNLWFHTGDAGYYDEDGYLWFSTKIKDAIRRRGENISAYEVEMVINSHPAVLESAAIAVPSELGEDDLKVVVILKGGQKLSHEDLLKYCEDHLAYFAVPRYVEFKDALPKTEMGDKTKKYVLKEEGITPNTWDREKAGYKLKR